jgi:hypothetical protein
MNANSRFFTLIAVGLLSISAAACSASAVPAQRVNYVDTRDDDRSYARSDRADRRMVAR